MAAVANWPPARGRDGYRHRHGMPIKGVAQVFFFVKENQNGQPVAVAVWLSLTVTGLLRTPRR